MKPSQQYKHLIVNADDFGMSRGINDGIIEAHTRGIVTSTSLMVTMPAASHGAHILKDYPKMSVGLHVVFTPNTQQDPPALYMEQLEKQYVKFLPLMGKSPTHIDVHGVPPITPAMRLATHLFLRHHPKPHRGQDGTNAIHAYYGMKGDTVLPKNIGLPAMQSLLRLLPPGLSLLVCHPGKTNHRLKDPYRTTRNLELAVLTSPQILALIREEGIVLLNYNKEVRFEDEKTANKREKAVPKTNSKDRKNR